jgi:hypothetical protein
MDMTARPLVRPARTPNMTTLSHVSIMVELSIDLVPTKTWMQHSDLVSNHQTALHFN